MALIQPWMLAIWAVVLLAAVVWYRRSARRAAVPDADAAPVAHTATLAALPRYRRLVRAYRRRLAIFAVAALVALIGCIGLSARVAGSTVDSDSAPTRDIELCLDVSGSMGPTLGGVTQQMHELAKQLTHDRVGLTIWNSAAVVKFPLTDDSQYVSQQLDVATKALTGPDINYISATLVEGETGSFIGDGLVSCIGQFDHPEARRPRSIIFASDGVTTPGYVYSIPEAMAMARAKGIRVYTISPVVSDDQAATDKLKAATLTTGGTFTRYDPEKKDDSASIVEPILKQEAKRLKGAPRTRHDDRPLVPFLLVAGGVVVLLLASRMVRP